LEARFAKRIQLTKPDGRPNINPAWAALKDIELIKLNIKNFGYELATRLATELPQPKDTRPHNLGITSRATKQSEIEAAWFAHWCAELQIPIVYHRKIWEFCFVLQTLFDAGLLEAGKRGIGFGCGEEPIPSYLASKGISVTATDLEPEKVAGRGWAETNQHTASLEKSWKETLVAWDEFSRLVSLKFVDMNAIPGDLIGYDFCWSICSLEHLGSIENGASFFKNSLKVLKPGGWSVHTTEFNIDDANPTIDHWPTVLFQRKHFRQIAEDLTNEGHEVAPLDFDTGNNVLDRFIDLPPYDWRCQSLHGRVLGDTVASAHLKLGIDGFPCTCFGMAIRKRA
jgi:hypothetical protein